MRGGDARFEREWARQDAKISSRRRRTDPAVEKLARILGLLGSDFDGEAVAAARKVETARRRTGRTWHQLLGLSDPGDTGASHLSTAVEGD